MESRQKNGKWSRGKAACTQGPVGRGDSHCGIQAGSGWRGEKLLLRSRDWDGRGGREVLRPKQAGSGGGTLGPPSLFSTHHMWLSVSKQWWWRETTSPGKNKSKQTTKRSPEDDVQLSYLKSLKMMVLKCCTQYASKFRKLSSGQRTGKGQFSFQSQRRAMPNYCTIELFSHANKVTLKVLQAGLQQYVNRERPDTFCWHSPTKRPGFQLLSLQRTPPSHT